MPHSKTQQTVFLRDISFYIKIIYNCVIFYVSYLKYFWYIHISWIACIYGHKTWKVSTGLDKLPIEHDVTKHLLLIFCFLEKLAIIWCCWPFVFTFNMFWNKAGANIRLVINKQTYICDSNTCFNFKKKMIEFYSVNTVQKKWNFWFRILLFNIHVFLLLWNSLFYCFSKKFPKSFSNEQT